MAEIDLLLARDNVDMATVKVKEVFNKFGHSPAVLLYISTVLWDMGQNSESQKILELAIEYSTDGAEKRKLSILLARRLAREDKIDQARRILNELDTKIRK